MLWIVAPFIFFIGLLSGVFNLIWSLAGGIFFVLGKLLSGIIGLVAGIIGISLCASIIGAVIGVPLLAIGGSMLALCWKR